MNTIDIIGQIADMKETDYKNTLAIAVLIELLTAKGYFSKKDFNLKARELDTLSLAEALQTSRQKQFGCSTVNQP